MFEMKVSKWQCLKVNSPPVHKPQETTADHSHIPKQCQMMLVYLGSEIHRDGIGWNPKESEQGFHS